MATTKKTTKKAKTTTKRAPARSTTATKVTRVARPKTTAVRSFRRAAPAQPFFTFKVTAQTVYWLILSGIVLLLGIWVLTISYKVQVIYDQIDQTNNQTRLLDEALTQKLKAAQQ